MQLLTEMLFSRQASAICCTAQHLDIPASPWQEWAVVIPFLENTKLKVSVLFLQSLCLQE